jgi:phosphatidylserine/phosphatidylglycerophosphate/cardiolipin synthase-like enzyme
MASKKSPRKAAKKTAAKSAPKPAAKKIVRRAPATQPASKPKKPSPKPAPKPKPKPTPKPTPKPAPTPAPKPSPAVTTYTLVTEPDQGLTAIYNLIATATKSIDMTMYELTDVTVMDAFQSAAAKGIAVRVILNQSGSQKATNTPAYTFLQKNKCGVHWSNPAFSVTHQKTITIDAATSAIMTLNLTPDDYAMTRDFAVITNDAADVAAIETTFNADYINATITAPTGDNLVWSPSNSLSSLLAIINGAQASLLISQEEFEETDLENALLAALKRGVQVTLVQENLENKYNTTLTTLKNAGAKIAVYTSSTGYYIHAKTVLADYGTATAKMFVGSENFTENSLEDNRELGLIFSDAACMTGVHNAITKDFSGGTPY